MSYSGSSDQGSPNDRYWDRLARASLEQSAAERAGDDRRADSFGASTEFGRQVEVSLMGTPEEVAELFKASVRTARSDRDIDSVVCGVMHETADRPEVLQIVVRLLLAEGSLAGVSWHPSWKRELEIAKGDG